MIDKNTQSIKIRIKKKATSKTKREIIFKRVKKRIKRAFEKIFSFQRQSIIDRRKKKNETTQDTVSQDTVVQISEKKRKKRTGGVFQSQ